MRPGLLIAAALVAAALVDRPVRADVIVLTAQPTTDIPPCLGKPIRPTFAPPAPTPEDLASLAQSERAFSRLELGLAESALRPLLSNWRRERRSDLHRVSAELLAARLFRVQGKHQEYEAAIAALALLHVWLPPDPAVIPPDVRDDIEEARRRMWNAPLVRHRVEPAPRQIRIGPDSVPVTHIVEWPAGMLDGTILPALDYGDLGWLPWPEPTTGAAIRPWTPGARLRAWMTTPKTPDADWLTLTPDGALRLMDGSGRALAEGIAEIEALRCPREAASAAVSVPAMGPSMPEAAAVFTPPVGVGTTAQPARHWSRSPWLWSGIVAGVAAGAGIWAAAREGAPPSGIEVRW